MIYVLYSSRPGSGKSTVKSMLTDRGMVCYKLADPIKYILFEMLRVNMLDDEAFDHVDGDSKGNHIDWLGFSSRQFQIAMGHGLRELLTPDIWLNYLKHEPANIVIDDMRYPNEYREFRRMGAILIRISRGGAEYLDSPSEGLLDDFYFDFEINNNGTLEDLENKVKDVLRSTYQPTS